MYGHSFPANDLAKMFDDFFQEKGEKGPTLHTIDIDNVFGDEMIQEVGS